MAKEAKSKDKAITSPPITAVNRALFRRHSATKKGDRKCDNAKLVEPIQTAKEEKLMSHYCPLVATLLARSLYKKNKLKRDNLTLLITEEIHRVR